MLSRMDDSTTNDTLIVLTNLPDEAAGRHLAMKLLEQGLAACVNMLAPCTSFYRWEGKVQADTETPLLIKTTRARYPALEAAILADHPYELPEIVAVPITAGLTAYLDWVAEETARPFDQ